MGLTSGLEWRRGVWLAWGINTVIGVLFENCSYGRITMNMRKMRWTRNKWWYGVALLPCMVAALVLTTVLAHAHAARPFSSSGSGTETSLSASGCQFTTSGCTVQSTGTANSSHLGSGSYVSTLTVNWAQATSNGAGGFCAPADGPSTLTAANGDTLSLSNNGTVCEVGATGANVPHTFVGKVTITGGTGRFAHASGSGTETGGDDGAGNSSYTLSGSITY